VIIIPPAWKEWDSYCLYFFGIPLKISLICVAPAIVQPFLAAASRHSQRPVFYSTVKECGDNILHGTANMGNDANPGRGKSGLLGLRNHSANQEIHSQVRQQFGSLEGILHNQGFFAAMLFPFIGDIHQENPACLIKNRRNPPMP